MGAAGAEGPPPGEHGTARARWPWACFAVAAAWVVLIRAPLVLNAPTHVDSDLAVDGLTLAEAVAGRWRWHYPGTPHIGSAGVLLSYPQALAAGPTPEALVSGGTVAALLVLLASFALAWSAYGPRAAAWSLVPLTFASNGAVWLSGRITGGHLLAAAWHAGAFALLVPAIRRPRFWTGLVLGLWAGFGLFVDSMGAVTLSGLVPAFVVATARSGRFGPALAGLVFGLLIGVTPRELGKRIEPYNAYGPQFEAVTDRDLIADHARILALDCLPRLIAGRRLPGFESDPDPTGLTAPSSYRTPEPIGPLAVAAASMALTLWLASTLALAWRALRRGEPAGRAVAAGLLASALATAAAFVLNRNIFNSDNYRYLVTLLVPWSVGFGLLFGRPMGGPGRAVAGVVALAFAGLMTADLGDWYARFGWVDDARRPVRAAAADPLRDWLAAHPEAAWIEAGYWDVYRLSFLTGGRVRGRPFAIYPDRFPEWAPDAGDDRFILSRPTAEGRLFAGRATRDGGRAEPGPRGMTIVRVPSAP